MTKNELNAKLIGAVPEVPEVAEHTENTDRFVKPEDIYRKETALADRLMEGIINKDIDAVMQAVSDGADINRFINRESSPIIAAAEFAFPEAMKFFISRGADVNTQNANGNTALIESATWGKQGIGMIKMLLEAGADVNAANSEGMTALIGASWQGDLDIIKLLVDAGAEVNAADKYLNTALHEATESKNIEGMRLLIQHGADVNAKGKYGKTILHTAVRTCSLESVSILVEAGADINTEDDFGRTPIDISSTITGRDTIRQYLKKTTVLRKEDSAIMAGCAPDFNI